MRAARNPGRSIMGQKISIRFGHWTPRFTPTSLANRSLRTAVGESRS
jgi:hypothetical protein